MSPTLRVLVLAIVAAVIGVGVTVAVLRLVPRELVVAIWPDSPSARKIRKTFLVWFLGWLVLIVAIEVWLFRHFAA